MVKQVSIPKRVSEALKLSVSLEILDLGVVSIPKRVSEALKLPMLAALILDDGGFNP